MMVLAAALSGAFCGGERRGYQKIFCLGISIKDPSRRLIDDEYESDELRAQSTLFYRPATLKTLDSVIMIACSMRLARRSLWLHHQRPSRLAKDGAV